MQFNPRWPPLEPLFAVTRGAATRALITKLNFTKVRGLVSGNDTLAITASELPWVDGIEYFGRDGASAFLLVPTTHVPTIPTAWLERRYRSEQPSLAWPCLLLDGALLPVGNAAPLDPEKLKRWLGDAHG